METRIACGMLDGETVHFVLYETPWPDEDEQVTLEIHAYHYDARRAGRGYKGFRSMPEAPAYCEAQYGIRAADWHDPVHFEQEFRFAYGVTDVGVPQPFVVGFDDAQAIICVSERLEDDNLQPVLNICGNREGLCRLAAMLVLCANSERYDSDFHIHLEDQGDWLSLPGMSATLRGPGYFESLVDGRFREGTSRLSIPSTLEPESDKGGDE